MLRKLELFDIEQIVELHYKSFGENELSIKLGKEFIRIFYESILNSGYSFGYVYVIENKIIAFAMGINDYERFNAYFKSNNLYNILKLIILKLFTFSISINTILNAIIDGKKYTKLRMSNCHLGALGKDLEFEDILVSKKAIRECVGKVIDTFLSSDMNFCWSVCDKSNVGMIKLHYELGFALINEVKQFGRTISVFAINNIVK